MATNAFIIELGVKSSESQKLPFKIWIPLCVMVFAVLCESDDYLRLFRPILYLAVVERFRRRDFRMGV